MPHTIKLHGPYCRLLNSNLIGSAVLPRVLFDIAIKFILHNWTLREYNIELNKKRKLRLITLFDYKEHV